MTARLVATETWDELRAELWVEPARHRTIQISGNQLVSLAWPVMVFVVVRRARNNSFCDLWCFVSNKENVTFNSRLRRPYLGHQLRDGSICLGNAPARLVDEDPITAFWQTSFAWGTLDIADWQSMIQPNGPGGRPTLRQACTSDKAILYRLYRLERMQEDEPPTAIGAIFEYIGAIFEYIGARVLILFGFISHSAAAFVTCFKRGMRFF